MSTDEGEISSVLRALADPTRRRVVEILSEGPHRVELKVTRREDGGGKERSRDQAGRRGDGRSGQGRQGRRGLRALDDGRASRKCQRER